MSTETRTTDQKGRVCLPRGFANTTVVLERVSDSEVRVRRAVVIPEDEVKFYEETRRPLCDADRDAFLGMVENPPGPNEALTAAFARHR